MCIRDSRRIDHIYAFHVSQQTGDVIYYAVSRNGAGEKFLSLARFQGCLLYTSRFDNYQFWEKVKSKFL